MKKILWAFFSLVLVSVAFAEIKVGHSVNQKQLASKMLTTKQVDANKEKMLADNISMLEKQVNCSEYSLPKSIEIENFSSVSEVQKPQRVTVRKEVAYKYPVIMKMVAIKNIIVEKGYEVVTEELFPDGTFKRYQTSIDPSDGSVRKITKGRWHRVECPIGSAEIYLRVYVFDRDGHVRFQTEPHRFGFDAANPDKKEKYVWLVGEDEEETTIQKEL